jgi:hypothetical protein
LEKSTRFVDECFCRSIPTFIIAFNEHLVKAPRWCEVRFGPFESAAGLKQII